MAEPFTDEEIQAHIGSLTPGARDIIDGSKAARIHKLQKKVWIPYKAANEVLKELERLFNFPKRERMPNMLIIGDTNNGKSSIISKFIDKHPPYPTERSTVIPIINIQCPKKPSPNELYETILSFLHMPFGSNDSESKKNYQVMEALNHVETKMLIIDELQDMYHGSTKEQRRFLTTIKHLSNDLQIPIVGSGIPDVRRTVAVDSQMANRFEPFELPRWKNDKDFARLVLSFEKTLPLKLPSNLASRQMLAKLHDMSEGLIGELSTVLDKAAEYAVEHGVEKIDMDVLSSIRFIKPNERSA